MKVLWFFLFTGTLRFCAGAKILALAPFPSRSHHNLFEPILTELAKKGHEVTYISSYKIKPSPNLKQVLIPDLQKEIISKLRPGQENKEVNIFERRTAVNWVSMLTLTMMGPTMMDITLSLPEMQNFLNQNEKFDAIFGEIFLDESLLAGLSYKYNAPLIGLATFMPNYWSNYMVTIIKQFMPTCYPCGALGGAYLKEKSFLSQKTSNDSKEISITFKHNSDDHLDLVIFREDAICHLQFPPSLKVTSAEMGTEIMFTYNTIGLVWNNFSFTYANSVEIKSKLHFQVGNPAPAAYIPDSILGYSTRMTFIERVTNTVFGLAQDLFHRLYYLPKQGEIMKRFFGNDIPPIEDIIKNTSLVLVNHHFSLAFPRPYLPNMVEVGGFHVGPPKPLPDDLKKYLDESKNGVILFSMGSKLKSSQIPNQMKQGILKAFARLKHNVIWKFEDDTLTDLPKNVKISKWLPQSDILAHPNLKLFITHGGLQSTTEAVHREVPLVGIPVVGDQHTNMKYATDAGFGVTLQFDDINEESFYNAISEVLNNPKYKKNIDLGSILLRDTPLPAMETALYWIEYVIRHKGAPHLRSAAQDLSWCQLYLLDVMGVLFIMIAGAFAINLYAIRYVIKRIFLKKTAKISSGKKNK